TPSTLSAVNTKPRTEEKGPHRPRDGVAAAAPSAHPATGDNDPPATHYRIRGCRVLCRRQGLQWSTPSQHAPPTRVRKPLDARGRPGTRRERVLDRLPASSDPHPVGACVLRVRWPEA